MSVFCYRALFMIFTLVFRKREHLLSLNPYKKSIILLYLSLQRLCCGVTIGQGQKPATTSQKADSVL